MGHVYGVWMGSCEEHEDVLYEQRASVNRRRMVVMVA